MEANASALKEVDTVEDVAGAEQRLRILHLIIVLGESNGQYNEHCLPLRHVRDIAVCTYFEPRLTAPQEIEVFGGDGTLRGFFRALGSALAAKEYDVVHAHAPETGALLLLGLALRPSRWRHRRSAVYTVQDSFYDYDLRDKVAMLASFPAFRRIVFCGQAAYESYPALWKRLAGRRARVVQNAADLGRVERAIAGQDGRRDDGSFDVVSIGRLEEVKDPATLLAAFRAAMDESSHLTLIGAGSLEADVVDRIESLSLRERVELTGLIPRDDVFVHCARADLFVSTSRGEGLPVAVIEAMATGCPVVLSDIPPHREVAEGVDFVPFVSVGDAQGFAHEIDRFRSMSYEERTAIGLKCRDLVNARFGLETMHSRLEGVYRELQ